jgi:CrcB protein
VRPPDDPITDPIDPDIDRHFAAQRTELTAHPALLATIAAGGAIGSAARYGVGLLLPHDPSQGLPWSTFTVNAVGCLLIGVLMALLTDVFPAHPLARPFLGVGVLGGFTTFSTYAVDARTLLGRGAIALGLGYLVLTLITALAAVTLGSTATRSAIRRVTGRREREGSAP